jgi:hypothetical protein
VNPHWPEEAFGGIYIKSFRFDPRLREGMAINTPPPVSPTMGAEAGEMPEFDEKQWDAARDYVAKYSGWLEKQGASLPPGFPDQVPLLLLPLTLELIRAQHTAKQITYAMIVIGLITLSFASLLFYYTIAASVIALILAFGFLIVIFVGFTGILLKRF